MPVLRRPFQNNMFGFSHPDPSWGMRGTAFRSYNPRKPQPAMMPYGADASEDVSDLMLPSPTPPPAIPSPRATPMPTMLPLMPTGSAPATPMFAHPNVAFRAANDANADAAYLKALPTSSDPIVNALRARSIAAKSGIANGFTGNQYLGREMATDANTRANNVTGATVRGMDANTNLMLPSLAREVDSRAGLNKSRSNEIDQMLPYQQDAVNADTWGKYIENAGNYQMLPLMPQVLQEQIRGTQIHNEFDQKNMPTRLKNEATLGAQNAQLNADREKLLEDQRRFVTMKTPTASTDALMPDPLDTIEKRYTLLKDVAPEAAKQMLLQELMPGYAPTPSALAPTNSFPQLMSGSTMMGPLGGLMPSPKPTEPTPTPAQAEQAETKVINGQRYVRRNGPKGMGWYREGAGQGKVLTADLARQILQETGGDRDKARQIARSHGYTF